MHSSGYLPKVAAVVYAGQLGGFTREPRHCYSRRSRLNTNLHRSEL